MGGFKGHLKVIKRPPTLKGHHKLPAQAPPERSSGLYPHPRFPALPWGVAFSGSSLGSPPRSAGCGVQSWAKGKRASLGETGAYLANVSKWLLDLWVMLLSWPRVHISQCFPSETLAKHLPNPCFVPKEKTKVSVFMGFST